MRRREHHLFTRSRIIARRKRYSTCLARGDAGSIEQLQVEPAFQRADRLAQRGLRHSKLSGRTREAARANDS
jgi:hypothetical protein